MAQLPWWPRPSSPARRRPGGWQLWCWVLGAGCTGLVLRQGWAHCGVNGGTGCCAHSHKSARTSSESASSLRSNQHGCVDVEAGTGGPRDIPYGAGGQPGPEWLLWPTRTDQVQTLGDEHGMVAVAGGRGQRTGTLGCAPSPPPPGRGCSMRLWRASLSEVGAGAGAGPHARLSPLSCGRPPPRVWGRCLPGASAAGPGPGRGALKPSKVLALHFTKCLEFRRP